MSKSENIEQLSIQISNLRKCRDGLIPYSTDSLRKAKQSILEPVSSSSSSSFSFSKNLTENPIRRKRIKSEESSLTIENGNDDEMKSNNQNSNNSKYHLINSSEKHDRLTSVTKILMETLEEQGILRSLLSHTSDYQFDSDENTSSQANITKNNNDNMKNTSQKNHEISLETRFQGSLMELEKTVQKLIQTRVECEQEKKKRSSLEKSLEIMTNNLEIANKNIDEMKKELEENQLTIERLRRERYNNQNYSQEKNKNNQNNQNKSNHDNHSDNDNNQLPPLPPPPLPLPLLPQYLNPSSNSSGIAIENENTSPIHDKKVINKSPNKSPNKSVNYQSTSSVMLDVDLGDGKKGRIDVNLSSNPIELAYQFIYEHALNPDYVYPLIEYISKTKLSLEEEYLQTSQKTLVKDSKQLVDESIHDNQSFIESPKSKIIHEKKLSYDSNIEEFEPPKEVDEEPEIKIKANEEKGKEKSIENKIEDKEVNKDMDQNLDHLRKLLESGKINTPDELLRYISSFPSDEKNSVQSVPLPPPPPLSSPPEDNISLQSSSSSSSPNKQITSQKENKLQSKNYPIETIHEDAEQYYFENQDHQKKSLNNFNFHNNNHNNNIDGINNSLSESISPDSDNSSIFIDLLEDTNLNTREINRGNTRNNLTKQFVKHHEDIIISPKTNRKFYDNSDHDNDNNNMENENNYSMDSSYSNIQDQSYITNGTFNLSTTLESDLLLPNENLPMYFDKSRIPPQINNIVDNNKNIQNKNNERDMDKSPPLNSMVWEKPKRRFPARDDLDKKMIEKDDRKYKSQEENNRKSNFDNNTINNNNNNNNSDSDSEIDSQIYQEEVDEPDSYYQDESLDQLENYHNDSFSSEPQLQSQSQSQLQYQQQSQFYPLNQRNKSIEVDNYSAIDIEEDNDHEDSDNISNLEYQDQDRDRDQDVYDPVILLNQMKYQKSNVNSQFQNLNMNKNQFNNTMKTPSNQSIMPNLRYQNYETLKEDGYNNKNIVLSQSPSKSPLSPKMLELSGYTGEGNIPEVIDELSTRAKNIDPLEVAIEVFDSATTMANNGNIDDAVPLYLHALQIFEEYNYEDLPMIREEVWRWVSLADNAFKNTSKKLENTFDLNKNTKPLNNITEIHLQKQNQSQFPLYHQHQHQYQYQHQQYNNHHDPEISKSSKSTMRVSELNRSQYQEINRENDRGIDTILTHNSNSNNNNKREQKLIGRKSNVDML